MEITPDLLKFLSDTPGYVILAAIVICVLGYMAIMLLAGIFQSLTIWFRGYPPPHCDAQGDAITREDDDDDDV